MADYPNRDSIMSFVSDTEVPIGSIMAIISTLTYFVSPVDLIPDTIPGLGYVDDTAIIATCLALVNSDIAEYKIRRDHNNIDTTFQEKLNTTMELSDIGDESEDIFSEDTLQE